MDNEFLISLLIDLLITIAVYMSVPIIIFILKENVSKSQAKKIATINSICGFIVFIILFIVLKRDLSLLSGLPVFFYGWINYLILSSKDKRKEEIFKYPNEEQENAELQDLINKIENDKIK